jgi:pimeloyl-ACP methyl ester carboxylesterase
MRSVLGAAWRHKCLCPRLATIAVRCSFTALLALTSVTCAFAAGPPDIASLFRAPRYSRPSLSPDGRYFVALFTEDDQTSLMSFNLETHEAGRTSLPDELQQLVSSKANVLEFFHKASPIHVAHQIRIPVFIAGGRNDRRVPIEQSYRLARAMRKAGNRPETYFKLDETHGFHYETNRVKYYERVLAFLEKHIGQPSSLPERDPVGRARQSPVR